MHHHLYCLLFASIAAMFEVVPAPLDMPAEQQRKVRAHLGMTQVGDHFGKYTRHNWRKTPFAAGDRRYVRTFDYLYCFGPSKP